MAAFKFQQTSSFASYLTDKQRFVLAAIYDATKEYNGGAHFDVIKQLTGLDLSDLTGQMESLEGIKLIKKDEKSLYHVTGDGMYKARPAWQEIQRQEHVSDARKSAASWEYAQIKPKQWHEADIMNDYASMGWDFVAILPTEEFLIRRKRDAPKAADKWNQAATNSDD